MPRYAICAVLASLAILASPAIASAQTTQRYVYDAAARLSQVETPSGSVVSYAYDLNDNRLTRASFVADLTPAPVDWPNMSALYRRVGSTVQSSGVTNGPTRTISGLSAGASITLAFSQVGSGGGAGLRVEAFKNNVKVANVLQVADPLGVGDGPSESFTVANGDIISFRLTVLYSGSPPIYLGEINRDLLVTNASTNSSIDVISLSGEYVIAPPPR